MPDPMDDPLGLPPLDLGETMAMGQPPPPSAPSALARAKDFAPLLALLPIAMAKGGQAGVASLLHGFQQARQTKQQTARQAQLDAERQRQVAEQERMRRATLAQTTANNDAARRQHVLTQFQGGLESLDNEAAVRAYLQLYGPQAQAVGLRPEALEGFAMAAVNPSRLQKKEAEKVLAEAKKTYGDQAVSHTYTLRDGTQANWEELNRRAGVGLGPVVPKVDTPNTPEEQFYQQFAVENGAKTFAELPTAKQAQARKQWMQADDRPITVNTGAAEARTNARIDRIVGSFNSHPIVKEYNEVQSQQGIIKNIVSSQWSGPGDMAAVFAFMKALDPNSVVRETEYANAAKSGNIFQGWAARFNGAINPNGGFLSERVRQDFLRTINARMEVKGRQYQNLRKQLVARVDRIKAGAPETGDEALVDYSGGAAPDEPAPTSTPRRADRSRNRVLPPPQSGPRIGERRSFNGQVGEWDGTGWKPVTP